MKLAIENMRLAKLAGAIILPPVVAYYPQPCSIEEVTGYLWAKRSICWLCPMNCIDAGGSDE